MTLGRAAAVSLVLLWLQGVSGTARSERTLAIPATQDRPALGLRVHQDESKGLVEVTSAKFHPQSLTCDLAPYTAFVQGFTIEDLDMDGHPDLRGVRELGVSCPFPSDRPTRPGMSTAS
jgi:hypothetical protein